MGQIAMQGKPKHVDDDAHSFSYNFIYLDPRKTSNPHRKDEYGRSAMDLYVAPKYCTFKEELLHNHISCIDRYTWATVNHEAQVQMRSNRYRVITATLRLDDYHPIYNGYKQGDRMEIKHLICVILYCSEDMLQNAYSETYRNRENETFSEVKHRHANFHHFAKALKEAVGVVGTFSAESGYNVNTFYHGVKDGTMFYCTNFKIHSVLSTTTKYSVSLQFAPDGGLIVEMLPAPNLKYLDVRWLSKYPDECECLFIGGDRPMHLVNIIYTSHYFLLKGYITALRAIDRMLVGVYFAARTKSGYYSRTTSGYYIYEDISLEIKALSCKLIEHEANRYNPDKYTNYQALPSYIDHLLHNMCVHKTTIAIDVKSVNTEYIGYSFMKDYICTKQYESVDLAFLNMILPSITHVCIKNLSSIDSLFLEDILHYLELHKTQIVLIQLQIEKQ
eukprot:118958_1